ncbi:hypothetical protein DFH07DRAFT_782168 [Mycena maculata]|uniref:Uncharacterized protein n=1 Tax=Mycena maculata TaxID=230809 RepID=A0AAD7HUC3_9AGAR|nr:hypothetical protein DFH07DRAFT_782168 [Mycena maculata]
MEAALATGEHPRRLSPRSRRHSTSITHRISAQLFRPLVGAGKQRASIPAKCTLPTPLAITKPGPSIRLRSYKSSSPQVQYDGRAPNFGSYQVRGYVHHRDRDQSLRASPLKRPFGWPPQARKPGGALRKPASALPRPRRSCIAVHRSTRTSSRAGGKARSSSRGSRILAPFDSGASRMRTSADRGAGPTASASRRKSIKVRKSPSRGVRDSLPAGGKDRRCLFCSSSPRVEKPPSYIYRSAGRVYSQPHQPLQTMAEDLGRLRNRYRGTQIPRGDCGTAEEGARAGLGSGSGWTTDDGRGMG